MSDLLINIKILILGDKAVGKTSIINKLFNKENNNIYNPTIGPKFNVYKKKINDEYNSNVYITELGSNSKDNIWLINNLLYKTNYLIFVIDLTSKNSLDYVNNMYKKIKNIIIENNIHINIIFNKNDLINTKENVNINLINFNYNNLQNINYKDNNYFFINKIINIDIKNNYKNISKFLEEKEYNENKTKFIKNNSINISKNNSNCYIF